MLADELPSSCQAGLEPDAPPTCGRNPRSSLVNKRTRLLFCVLQFDLFCMLQFDQAASHRRRKHARPCCDGQSLLLVSFLLPAVRCRHDKDHVRTTRRLLHRLGGSSGLTACRSRATCVGTSAPTSAISVIAIVSESGLASLTVRLQVASATISATGELSQQLIQGAIRPP